MKTLILGAGALGSLFGARLSTQDRLDLCLYSTNKNHITTIQQQGLAVEELDGSQTMVQIPAYFDPASLPGPFDLVLVLVKAYQTQVALKSILPLTKDHTTFLTLQNGYGNWKTIAKILPQARILLGTTAQGATLLKPGYIRHGGQGPTFVGTLDPGLYDTAREVVELLQGGLECTFTADPMKLIWKKLLINVGINALTGLAQVPNGLLATSEHAQKIVTDAIQEACQVAQANGYEMDPYQMVGLVLKVSRSTARNRSSMNQDLARGKPTEIDYINGAIVQLGKKWNIPAPVNKTLTNLIKFFEELKGEKQ